MPPACEPRRSYRSSSPISIVTGWSSGSSRARACPRESGGQEGSVRHSLAHPARTNGGALRARRAGCLPVSPGCFPATAGSIPVRVSCIGSFAWQRACRHHQACRRSYAAALLRHPSLGAEDRYSDHSGFIRSHGILPANTRRKPRSTTLTIRNSVRLSSSEGVSSRTTSKWQSSCSPTARLPACQRGCSPNRLHNTEYADPQRFQLHFCSLCVSKSMRSYRHFGPTRKWGMNAMPRNSKTLESEQRGVFEQIQPEIVVTPVQQQQLTMLIEALLSEIAWALATGEVGNDQDHR